MAAVLAHTLYGTPATAGTYLYDPATTRRADWSGVEYVSERQGKCLANDDTCKGPRAKDTEYCIGHLRSIAKAVKADNEQG